MRFLWPKFKLQKDRLRLKKKKKIFRISYRNKRISYRDFKSNEIYITKFTLHFKTLTIIKKAIKAKHKLFSPSFNEVVKIWNIESTKPFFLKNNVSFKQQFRITLARFIQFYLKNRDASWLQFYCRTPAFLFSFCTKWLRRMW